MNLPNKGICVAIGGGLGAYTRYAIQSWVQQKVGSTFPYGTLLINISGSFLIGLLMTVFLKRMEMPEEYRFFLVVGVLGGYTTFSSLSWETYQMVASGYYGLGLTYVLSSILGGGVAVMGGVCLGRLL